MSDNKMRDRLIELLKQAELINKDVVSVVRCKDCKYKGELDCPMYHEELEDYDDGDYVYTDLVATDRTVDDGFCHCGKRDFE